MSYEKKEQLKEWIENKLKEGSKPSEVKAKLIEGGIPRENADKLLRGSRKIKNRKIIVSSILGVAIVIVLLILIINAWSCNSQKCFIETANACKSAKLTQIENGTIFSYSVQDCVLTKTLVKLDASEPQDFKDLLQGASMICSYTPGNFDSNWVTSISLGLDSCTGPLADGINSIINTL